MPEKTGNPCIKRTSTVLRLISLAVLFGGSSAIVFAAITLVKAAEAQGIPATQAATANAPLFLNFSKVLFGAGAILLLAESLDFSQRVKPRRLTIFRYAASLLCAATAMIFSLGIVPPMAELLPLMKGQPNMAAAEVEKVHADFRKLHELSRAVFGGTILLALVSLVLPAFEPTCESLAPGVTSNE